MFKHFFGTEILDVATLSTPQSIGISTTLIAELSLKTTVSPTRLFSDIAVSCLIGTVMMNG
jgi:hypothetical protein